MKERPPTEKSELQHLDITLPFDGITDKWYAQFQWPHDLTRKGKRIHANVHVYFPKPKDAVEAERWLIELGYTPKRDNKTISFEQVWKMEDIQNAAASQEDRRSQRFFRGVLALVNYQNTERKSVESLEEFSAKRKETFNVCLVDYSNVFYKEGYGFNSQSFETEEGRQHIDDWLRRNPIPTVEESFKPTNYPITYAPEVLKYCRNEVEQINAQVAILNNTRDPNTYKRGANKILFIIYPEKGPNQFYKEPEASAEFAVWVAPDK